MARVSDDGLRTRRPPGSSAARGLVRIGAPSIRLLLVRLRPGGAQALARCPLLANLTELEIDEATVGAGGRAALEARFGEDVLTWW